MDIRDENDIKAVHDRMVCWCNFLFAFIAKRLGEEAVGEVNQQLVEEIYTPRFLPLKTMTAKQRFENLCRSHRANFSEIEREEDAQAYRVIVRRCGSGGFLKKEGLPQDYGAVTTKAYPWSFGRAGVPYYCIHGSCFNHLFNKMGLDIEVTYHDDFCIYTIRK
jgi:hypothetical protein